NCPLFECRLKPLQPLPLLHNISVCGKCKKSESRTRSFALNPSTPCRLSPEPFTGCSRASARVLSKENHHETEECRGGQCSGLPLPHCAACRRRAAGRQRGHFVQRRGQARHDA